MSARSTFVAIVAVAGSLAAAGQGSRPAGVDVDGLLARLDGSARAYRDLALRFACEETIKWSGHGGRRSTARTAGRERFGYVFVYEDGDGFTDYRTRIRRRPGGAPPRRVTAEEYNVPRYLSNPFLWIFTFRASRHDRHVYEIVGREDALGRPAVVVSFRPDLPIEPGINDWYGTAWVDAETALLLKVVAMTPDDHARVEEMNRHAAGEAVNAWVFDVERVTTYFEIEEHGLRFPSRVEIRRTNYHLEPGRDGFTIRPEPLLQVDQVYDGYEFFGVDTATRQGATVPHSPGP